MRKREHDANSKAPRQLDTLLQLLPREKASSGFAKRVLQRLATENAPPARPSWKLLLVASCFPLILFAGIWRFWKQEGPPPFPAESSRAALGADADYRRALLRQLREEYRSIEAEMEDRGAGNPDLTRVLSLGNSNGYEILLDLDSLKRWAELPAHKVLATAEPYRVRPL